MPNALPNIQGDLFSLDADILRTGVEASRASERRRMILPLHREQEAPVQRMLNFFQPGTYVQPHLHPLDGAIETICILQGRLGFVLFDEEGNITEKCDLRPGASCLVDVEPRVWHGMAALEEDTVILEIKQGPYDPSCDKVFADWAPTEGEDGWEEMVAKIAKTFA